MAQSEGPLEIDRPWDAYTDDHIDLMDHLGTRECVTPWDTLAKFGTVELMGWAAPAERH